MDRGDRAEFRLAHRAVAFLIARIKPNAKITIKAFDHTPRLKLSALKGQESAFENCQNQRRHWHCAPWCINGYLSEPRLNKNKLSPMPVTYRERFGTLTDAYRRIGHRPVHAYRYSKAGEHIRRTHRNLICRLTSTVHYSVGKIIFSVDKQVLQIDESIAVAVIVLPYLPRSNTVLTGWKLYFDRLEECDAVLIARMEKSNNYPLDYFLLPRNLFSLPSIRFTETTVNQFTRYKLRSLASFYRASKKSFRRAFAAGLLTNRAGGGDGLSADPAPAAHLTAP